MRRAARTVLVGVMLGVGLSFGYVSLAQTSGVPVPLVTALQAAAVAADVDLVVAGVPDVEVYLPPSSDDWSVVLRQLAAVYGLAVCGLGPSTVLVTDSPQAATLCGGSDEEQGAEEPSRPLDGEGVGTDVPAAEGEPGDDGDTRPGAVSYRVRVLQLDEARARDLGLDWGSGVFDVAGRIAVAGYQVLQGVWPSASLADVVRFLESEGVAMRLDDVELRTRSGETVRFQRGGTINVNLVGGGDASITQRYDYGLTLDLAGELQAEGVVLRYVFSDSAPGNVSDPRNVQLATTTAGGVVDVPCGHATVLAAMGTRRESLSGEGLPALAAMSGAGYAFGTTTATASRVSYVVTVDVGCRS